MTAKVLKTPRKKTFVVGGLIILLADGFLHPIPRIHFRKSKSCSYFGGETQVSEKDSAIVMQRRRAIENIISLPLILATAAPSMAVTDEENATPATTTILKGLVTLEDGLELPSSEASTSSSALYVTCRPNKPDNVPGAILSGTRGKPPPVMAARFENPTFPFEFTLSSPTDLTIEGASDGTSNSSPVLDPDRFWWNKDDLIVSARWDSDGVAATRSPEDLVGRGIWTRGDKSAEVILTGRGAFGKFATGKSK